MLQGFTVGITSNRFNGELAGYFDRNGASSVCASCLEVRPTLPTDGLRQVTQQLIEDPPDALVVVTAAGVAQWLSSAEEWGRRPEVSNLLKTCTVYARGAKAREFLARAGVTVAGPPVDTTEQLVASLPTPGRVGVVTDGSGVPPDLPGADVEIVAPYQWMMPADSRPALRLVEGTISGRVHAVTFTARPAVLNWLQVAGQEGIIEPLRQSLASGQVIIGCVGAVCAGAFVQAGVETAALVVPPTPSIAQLAHSVAERLARRVVRAGGHHGPAVVLTGTTATIEGQSYSLTPAEAKLLSALVRAPNTVLSQEELLAQIWGGSAHDPHLVEVVVARLQRRLGPFGQAITSIPRRGYALRL